MIRVLVRCMGLAIVLAVLTLGLQAGKRVLAEWEDARSRAGGDLAGPVRKLTAYRLDAQRWTEFPAAPPATTVRLVSHADLLPGFARAGGRVRYALQVEVVQRDGEVLLARQIEAEAGVRFYRVNGTGRELVRRFYRGSDALPAETRESLVRMPEGNPWTLRMKIATASPELQGVHVRLYQREQVNPARLDYLWERLTRGDRERLAEGLLFPVETLTREERRNLVRNRWRPSGPRGIEGDAFEISEIYSREDPRLQPVVRPFPVTGMYADRAIRATFRIPAGGELQAEMVPVTPDGLPQAQGAAVGMLRLWPDGADVPILVGSFVERLRSRVPAGMAELLSRGPVRLRASLQPSAPAPEVLLEPEAVILRAYPLDPTVPLVYPVRHVADGDTLLRLDLRSIASGSWLEPKMRPLKVQTWDAAGQLLQTHALEHVPHHSFHDYHRGPPVRSLGEADRYYWRLSAETRAVAVLGPADVFVAAYNRPGDLPARRTRGEGEDDAGDRNWFPLRPREPQVPGGSRGGELLHLGVRPPRAGRLLDEPYLWEDFAPEGGALVRQVIEPHATSTQRRPALLYSFFVRLKPGRQQLRLAAPTQLSTLRPELLYDNPGPGFRPVRVGIAGRTSIETRVPPGTGTLRLPRIRAGRVMVDTNAPGVQLYLNHVTSPARTGILRRSVIGMEQDRRTFLVQKHSDAPETLSVRFYRAGPGRSGAAARIELQQMGLATGGPYRALTLPVAEITLHAGDVPARKVVAHPDPLLAHEPVFFRLGDDLPAGTYRLVVDWPGGGNDYVLLSRVLAGAFASARVLRLDGAAGVPQGGEHD